MNKINPMHADMAVPITTDELNLLHLDPKLGIGNFAFMALAVSRDPDVPILQLSEQQTIAKGKRIAEVSLTGLTSYAEQWAHWYWKKGVRAHDVVGVYAQDGIHQILHFCALTLIGAVPAITNGNMPGEIATAHFRFLRLKGLACSAEQKAALDPEFCATLDFCTIVENTPLPRKPEPIVRYNHAALDPVMITHSSGTTGRPKPVTLAHAQWFHGIRDNLARQGGRTGERRLLSLPASHNSSIAFIIHAVLDGSQVLIAPDQSGDFAADAIERFQPQTVAAFPVTYVNLALKHAGNRDFSSVQYWVNSGDAAHQKHIRRLVTQGQTQRDGKQIEGSVFVDGLGSSEMGHISFPIQHTRESQNYDRCIGRPHQWVEAEIFDDTDMPVADNVVGRLGLKSPSITPGYWNDSGLTARSKVNGFFLTGDMVRRNSRGLYFHVDRDSDVILTSDGPCYSLLSEEFLMNLDEIVDDCIVSALPGEDGKQLPVALVWSERDAMIVADPLLDNFNEALASRDMPLMHAVAVVTPNVIPRGITGKVLKRQLILELDTVSDDPATANWIQDFAVVHSS